MNTLTLLLLSVAAPPGGSSGVLLDFTATWCGPCQQMSPVVHRLQRQGYPIRKIDADKDQAIFQRFGVTSMPTFVLVVNGKEVNRIVGMTSEGQLKRLLAQIPPASHNIADRGRSRSKPSPRRSTPRESNSEPEQQAVVRAKYDERDEIETDVSRPSPMASSVRIRVKDAGGVNFGSGTIIDSRPGRSVILTCGHVFRDLSNESVIEVDVFGKERHETFVGRVIKFDLKADCGLISIPTDKPLPICQVAPPDHGVAQSANVFGIGCDGGDPPSKQNLRVTSLNRYRGPDNIECTGVPVPGRSGGGLFDSSGRVVGVCFAADKEHRRGLYCGLKPIHALLDQCQLTRIYRPETPSSPYDSNPIREMESTAVATTRGNEPRASIGVNDTGVEEEPPFDDIAEVKVAQRERSTVPVATSDAPPRPRPAVVDPTVREAIDQAGEAEVICIIRPLGNPQAASQVVIINQASPRFLRYLKGEVDRQPQATTSYRRNAPTGADSRTYPAAWKRNDSAGEKRQNANIHPHWLKPISAE